MLGTCGFHFSILCCSPWAPGPPAEGHGEGAFTVRATAAAAAGPGPSAIGRGTAVERGRERGYEMLLEIR